jgi:hypothetical protein
MVNADDPKSWPLIEKLGVDAIPHLSLLEADGTVDTALIGPVPKEWLIKDIDVLLNNAAASTCNSAADVSTTIDKVVVATIATTITGADDTTTTTTTTTGDADADSATTTATTTTCQPLPYQMLDVFANKPSEQRKIIFDMAADSSDK